jgi:hypothetical protein
MLTQPLFRNRIEAGRIIQRDAATSETVTQPATPSCAAWTSSAWARRSVTGLNRAPSEHRSLRTVVAALVSASPPTLHLIRGAAAHDLYHAGQIRLLRRLQDDSE